MMLWMLSEEHLKVIDVDAVSRKATVRLDLKLLSPMTDAEAKKFIDNNFPEGGPVSRAADILGLPRALT